MSDVRLAALQAASELVNRSPANFSPEQVIEVARKFEGYLAGPAQDEDTVQRLVAIVHRFAKYGPPGEDLNCTCCWQPVDRHAADCPWRLAVELCEEQGWELS